MSNKRSKKFYNKEIKIENNSINKLISETTKNLRNKLHNNETEKIKEVKKSFNIYSINNQDNTPTDLDNIISDMRKRNEELVLKKQKNNQMISELKVLKIKKSLENLKRND